MAKQPRKAVIRNGQIIYGDDIAADVIKPNETAAHESREDQKLRFRGELLQRNQVDYYKKYPEQLENLSPELRRALS
jgi:hypothetical protein